MLGGVEQVGRSLAPINCPADVLSDGHAGYGGEYKGDESASPHGKPRRRFLVGKRRRVLDHRRLKRASVQVYEPGVRREDECSGGLGGVSSRARASSG